MESFPKNLRDEHFFHFLIGIHRFKISRWKPFRSRNRCRRPFYLRWPPRGRCSMRVEGDCPNVNKNINCVLAELLLRSDPVIRTKFSDKNKVFFLQILRKTTTPKLLRDLKKKIFCLGFFRCSISMMAKKCSLLLAEFD